jgi:HK97 family phage major capsid protein
MKITEIQARLEDISVELEALTEIHGDEPSAEQQETFLALNSEAKGLESDLDSAKAFESAKAEIVARRAAAVEPAKNVQPKLETPKEEAPQMSIPAVAKRCNSKFFASSEDAFVSGQALLAEAGNRKAREFMAAQSLSPDADGGFTVPTPLASTLINLLEEVGVARKVCKRIAMSASTWSVPKLLSHASVSYPGEAGAISDSDVQFGQIQLVATKVASLVKMSTEIQEDSIISMMDTVVQSMAYSTATAEDQNLFNGVAGGINANGIAGDANIVSSTVANVAALSLADLTALTVATGNPVVGARNEWYLNSTLYHGQIRDLMNAAPGNTQGNFEGGQRPTLLGYPVNFVNVLAGASATSGDLVGVFGDMSLGCYFGDRRAYNFRTLTELYANTDQIGVQATERVDIKVANPEVLAKLLLA